jgi:translation elongation factor EF-G
MENRKIIFLHIPKTGGTTLFGVSNNQYSKSQIYNAGIIREDKDFEKFKILSPQKQEKIAFIRGHMYYGFHRYIEQPSTYIVLLRNPVDRVISHYYHALRDTDHYLHQQVIEKNLSLEDYTLRPISHEMDNGQTRSIAGVGSRPPIGGITPEIFQTAKDNLSINFSIVGVLDHFDEFLIMLRKEFGWKYPVYYKRRVAKNKQQSQAKNPATQELKKAIAEVNKYDMELYLTAKENFVKMIEQNKELLEKELPILRKLNIGYARYGAFREFVKKLLGRKTE